MWPPLDKSALPSREEIVHTKQVIETLEDAISDAFELIETDAFEAFEAFELTESTKLQIGVMKRDLEERKAWIAPIRTVPTEILIDIFLWASEMNDLAPIRFAAVCRLWRNIILATPKAWSFINLIDHYNIHVYLKKRDDYFPGYKNIYFERSKPRLLHLALPNAAGFYTEHSNSIIKEQAHRLQCLTTHPDILSDTQSAKRCQQFPHLKKLTLRRVENVNKLDTSFFTISRFPALRTLRWPHCYPLSAASPTISPSNFPPLQHLSVTVGLAPSCMEILRSCAATLKTLRINWSEGRTTTSPLRIYFPFLKLLIVESYRSFSGSSPVVNAATPALTSLVVHGNAQIPTFFKADLQKLTHIRLSGFPALPLCASVRVLQMSVYPQFTKCRQAVYASCAKWLEQISGAHPSLEIIELSSGGERNFRVLQQNVEECLEGGGLKPKLMWTEQWMVNLPGNEPETVSSIPIAFLHFIEYRNSAARECLATSCPKNYKDARRCGS